MNLFFLFGLSLCDRFKYFCIILFNLYHIYSYFKLIVAFFRNNLFVKHYSSEVLYSCKKFAYMWFVLM